MQDKWQCIHCGNQNLWDMWRCSCGVGFRPEKAILAQITRERHQKLTEATNPMQQDVLEAGGQSQKQASEVVPAVEPGFPDDLEPQQIYENFNPEEWDSSKWADQKPKRKPKRKKPVKKRALRAAAGKARKTAVKSKKTKKKKKTAKQRK